MLKIENQNKEFKQIWNDNCFKTICAFANTGCGRLIRVLMMKENLSA
jgi:predicted HTH transcriptional regulator